MSTWFPIEADSEGFLACHRLAAASLPPHRLRALLTMAEGNPVTALTLIGEPRLGLTAKQSERLAEAVRMPVPAKVQADALRLGVYAVLYTDPAYPALLTPLEDAPPLLFLRGAFSEQAGVAIVGSRRSTTYGKTQSERFAKALAEAGLCLVSGGAAGIDTAVHKATLEVGGTTIAITACGLDICYPAENRKLFDSLAQTGAVVSEYPLGTTPEPWRFPARNRIIAGMCPLTLVIEAPEASGALITARNAAEYGREVYVVPGPVDTGRSRGGHLLIQDGAALADSPEDILAALNAVPQEVSVKQTTSAPVTVAPAPPPDLPPDEAALYSRLGMAPLSMDDATEAAGLSAPQAAVAVTLLEMKGLIRREPGGMLVRL